MCHHPKGKVTWDRRPKRQVQVGEIPSGQDQEPYILLSVGNNRNEQDAFYALWWPQRSHLPHLIDRVTRGPNGWEYVRQFECKNAACIAAKYLGTLNQQFREV